MIIIAVLRVFPGTIGIIAIIIALSVVVIVVDVAVAKVVVFSIVPSN
jgi:hypothetical protein